jgi:hypothetical protein
LLLKKDIVCDKLQEHLFGRKTQGQANEKVQKKVPSLAPGWSEMVSRLEE